MVADLIAAAFVLTIVVLFVRPNSQGQAFLTSFTSALVAVIKQVTDIADGTDTGTADDSNTQGN